MWLSFASIPNYTARFYDVSFDAVDWFSSTFFIVCLFAGFISILVLSKCGLRIPVSYPHPLPLPSPAPPTPTSSPPPLSFSHPFL